MLYLSVAESKQWQELAGQARDGAISPDDPLTGQVRDNLLGAFRYYVGTMLSTDGDGRRGLPWFEAGAKVEADGLFLNTFLVSFLERQGRLHMPEVIFADPRPFVHFSTVPAMHGARTRFVKYAADSLPAFDEPLRLMDIGCGNGALTVLLLQQIQAAGKADAIGEILLVDPSAGMVELAEKTVRADFPAVTIRTINAKIQDVAAHLDGRYDVAVSSLAYHHMPMEAKREHMRELAPHIDHFVLFELDADNDTPEQATPELALAVYQSYGRIIDFVFAHDAPLDVAVCCVDNFLMSEAVSFITQPRGRRTDYHMMRSQWHELFRDELGEGFAPRCDGTCYSDEYIDLYTLHYGRP